ncbi:unnamed protein product [Miscanthus lutarioriparius]|uniref:Osmotin-like protein n=1 Tax=Miscanthus lutarioriparius TaxID=422564 RepID=A0A811QHJ8_9POAL|nr:unnamed protein product [Miscanthus lutarioriparius]
MAIMSPSSKTIGALMMTLVLATVAVAARQPPSPGVPTTTTNLTLHNLCPYPVWPLVTPNAGVPSIPTDADGEPAGRLDGNGEGLATLAFPPGAWLGRVVARTGCAGGDDDDEVDAYGNTVPPAPFRCATGDAPPVTVAQVSVGGPGGAAAYSVSLVDGFNVAVVVTPHGMPPPEGARRGRRCPTLGCAVDLAAECPVAARAPGGGCGAGATQAALFKHLCPDTRTNATDVEVTPQDCVDPGEIKVVFCPKPDSVLAGHL